MRVEFIVVIVCFASLVTSTPETHRHGAHKTAHEFSDGTHNPVFDQEALLGSHKMDELADLASDVRLKRLQNLAKSHDRNNNNIIEKEELQEWVAQSFRMLDREEAMEKFEEEDENADGKLTFEELLLKQFGYSKEELLTMQTGDVEEDEKEVLELIEDDQKHFEAADLNNDGVLVDAEYVAFFQPHDYPHMFDVEVAKTMKEYDVNKDGLVTFEEFAKDETDSEERIALKTNFDEFDKDKDGQLTLQEMHAYALPDSNETAKEEAEHLLNMCDENSDGQLSMDEIVSKEEEFISSSATDYGRTLHFVKDEL